MNYFILAETEFFNLINGNDETINLHGAYKAFVKAAIELCCSDHAGTGNTKIALAYMENELQFHRTQYMETGKSHIELYVLKALSFVRKMQKILSSCGQPFLARSTAGTPPETDTGTPSIRWTGKSSDLVELIYGVCEMGWINDGEASLKEIAAYFYKVFGVQAKGCYNIYNDIKTRKNESRTYFLDRAAEKVNKRMLLDEERERMRR